MQTWEDKWNVIFEIASLVLYNGILCDKKLEQVTESL